LPKVDIMRQGIRAGKTEELMEMAGDKAITSSSDGRVEIEGRSSSEPLMLKGGRSRGVAVIALSRGLSRQDRHVFQKWPKTAHRACVLKRAEW
jgi:hypothetical protein